MIPKSQGFPRMRMATKADAQKVPVLCTSESPKTSGDFFFLFLSNFIPFHQPNKLIPHPLWGLRVT